MIPGTPWLRHLTLVVNKALVSSKLHATHATLEENVTEKLPFVRVRVLLGGIVRSFLASFQG